MIRKKKERAFDKVQIRMLWQVTKCQNGENEQLAK